MSRNWRHTSTRPPCGGVQAHRLGTRRDTRSGAIEHIRASGSVLIGFKGGVFACELQDIEKMNDEEGGVRKATTYIQFADFQPDRHTLRPTLERIPLSGLYPPDRTEPRSADSSSGP